MTERRIVLKLDADGNAQVYGHEMPIDVDALVFRAIRSPSDISTEYVRSNAKHYELLLGASQATTRFTYDDLWFELTHDRLCFDSGSFVIANSKDAARSIYLMLIAWAREVISDRDPYEAHRLRLQALRVEPRMRRPVDPPAPPPRILCSIDHEDFV